MLDQIDPYSLKLIMGFMLFGCIIVGMIISAILRDLGFGGFINTALVEAGAFGGLYGFDWLIRHHYVLEGHATAYTWTAAVVAGATGLVLVACLIKSLLHH